jgi:hypothetical protein
LLEDAPDDALDDAQEAPSDDAGCASCRSSSVA